MDDDATQPATQQILDPRRVGQNNSGLNQKDAADILAILHPASPGAIRIVEGAAEDRRHHVLFRNPYDSYGDEFTDIEEQETIIIDRPEVRIAAASRAGADLALRMSSPLITPSLGFVFGRNTAVADIVIGQDSGKRISNQHFRIYLNSDGILMLEDMSTNGTLVDEIVLRHKDPRFNTVRMLGPGSIICIHNSADAEMIKFVVRIPSRVSHAERYEQNLREFMARCAPDGEQIKALQRPSRRQFGGPTMKWDGGDRYNIIGQLGKGAFATVYQLATKMEGKLLAAKELEKRRFMKNGQLDKKIDNEMKIMQTVRHPNIVEFVEYQDQGDHLYIIMEFVRYGDLQGYLNQNGNLSEPQAKMMAQQILSALSYLHRAKITHRDIKPDNILIAEVEPFRVKLSDFGLSKVVKHEETFLKTFCGTLLYCAPEVFPDFEGKAAQGTKRRRGAKQKFHSYSSSVDIWSFAAVLWFALCGKPPFEGIADATGRAMYNNIMTTRLDPTPLRNAGVSEPCISLLCQMLQTDPALRPTDRDCLNHPWLRDGVAIPEDPALQSIVEEDESDVAGEQLSQLSLREEILESEEEEEASGVLEDEDFEKLVNHPAAKKVRTDPVPARYQLGQAEEVSYADPSFPSGHIVENGHRVEESFSIMGKAAAGRERLFGEIGESALESSGILSAHANNALSHDASSSEVLPDTVAPQNVTPQAQRRTQERGLTSPTLVGRAQLDGVFSSPSLLGAESMVRELNMESPHSPVSGTHSPNEPTTPKTPDVPQHNSLEGHSHRVSQISDSTPKAKPPALNRQISLPKTASFYYDPFDPSTHTLEYASRVSGFDFVGAAQATMPKDQHLPDTVRFSTDTGENTSHETSQTGRSTSSEEVVALPPELSIKPPPRRLGKLTATADSFNPNLTLMIERSLTSWGRNRDNTIVYEDPQDIRVSKRSFNIFWYTSDATSIPITDLSQQGKDWTSLPGLHVGIFTCATSGISINGKHLRQNDDKGRALWGHLHTGDIVQVYANPLSTECLKFKCEFHLGSAKMPRPPGESFVILHGDKLPGRGGSILNA